MTKTNHPVSSFVISIRTTFAKKFTQREEIFTAKNAKNTKRRFSVSAISAFFAVIIFGCGQRPRWVHPWLERGGGLRLGKRFAAHLGVDLFDLRWEEFPDVLCDARLLEDHFPNRFNARLHLRRLGTPLFLHLFAQFDKVALLLAEQFAARHGSVSGANRFGSELLR